MEWSGITGRWADQSVLVLLKGAVSEAASHAPAISNGHLSLSTFSPSLSSPPPPHLRFLILDPGSCSIRFSSFNSHLCFV